MAFTLRADCDLPGCSRVVEVDVTECIPRTRNVALRIVFIATALLRLAGKIGKWWDVELPPGARHERSHAGTTVRQQPCEYLIVCDDCHAKHEEAVREARAASLGV